MLFTILERFKSTLVTLVLKVDADEANGFLDLWKNAAPHTPFELTKLKKMTWSKGSDLTVVANFFETVQVTQYCKLDIAAICNEREIGGHGADARDMEVIRLARAIERAGSQAIVDVMYYPASSLSARMGHFAQLSRSFIGTRSELHLAIQDSSYNEQDGVQPAIDLLHGLVKQGISQAVYKLCLGVCDTLPVDSYRSSDSAATLSFDKLREVSLETGERYTMGSAFQLHFLLDRLVLPGLETFYLDISEMEEHEGCSEALHAVQSYLSRWPALKALTVCHSHMDENECGAGAAFRQIQEKCEERGVVATLRPYW